MSADTFNWVTLIVNVGLLGMAAIAAIIAWRGVNDARAARDEANTAAASARQTADAAAASAASAAESLARMAGPDHPWTLTRDAPSTWTLLNNSSRNVEGMSLEVADADAPEGIVTSTHMSLTGPNYISQGEPIRLQFNGGTITDPHEVRILVRYRFEGEDQNRTWVAFLRA